MRDLERLLQETAVRPLEALDLAAVSRHAARRRRVRTVSGLSSAVLAAILVLSLAAPPPADRAPVIGELPPAEQDVDDGPSDEPRDDGPTLLGAERVSAVAPAHRGQVSPGDVAEALGKRGEPDASVDDPPPLVVEPRERVALAPTEWDFENGPSGWTDMSRQHQTQCPNVEHCTYPFAPFEGGFAWDGGTWQGWQRPQPPRGGVLDELILMSPDVFDARGRLEVGYRIVGDADAVQRVKLFLTGLYTQVEQEAGGANVASSQVEHDERSFSRDELGVEGVLVHDAVVPDGADYLGLSIRVDQLWSPEGEPVNASGFEVLWVRYTPR